MFLLAILEGIFPLQAMKPACCTSGQVSIPAHSLHSLFNSLVDAIETLPDNLTALIVAAVVGKSASYNTLYTVQAVAPASIPSTGLNITRVPTTPYGLFYQARSPRPPGIL